MEKKHILKLHTSDMNLGVYSIIKQGKKSIVKKFFYKIYFVITCTIVEKDSE